MWPAKLLLAEQLRPVKEGFAGVTTYMYMCIVHVHLYVYALVSQPDIHVHVHVYFPRVSIHVHTNNVWLARLHETGCLGTSLKLGRAMCCNLS